MERNPWKVATIGMALVGTTALGTGITTAYVMRTPASDDVTNRADAPLATTAPRALVASPAVATPRALGRAAAPAPPRVTPVSTAAATPADWGSGGGRGA